MEKSFHIRFTTIFACDLCYFMYIFVLFNLHVLYRARDENDATSTGTLTVSLTDVNDNAPVFTGTPYTAEAQEGQASCKHVIKTILGPILRRR